MFCFPQLETYVDVEPLSGATFRGHKRLQYTVKVTKWAFDFPYWDKLFTNALVDQVTFDVLLT